MKHSRYLAVLLAASTLASLQSCAVKPLEPDASQKVAKLAQPAVVRILNPCKGIYEWYPQGKSGVQKSKFEFDLSTTVTGFLIHPDGYIVTSAPYLSITNEQKCRERLKENIRWKLEENNVRIENSTFDQYFKDHGYFSYFYDEDNYPKVLLPNTDLIKDIMKPKKLDVIKQSTSSGESGNIGQDITIIKIPVKDAPTLNILSISDTVEPKMLERVIAIGYPNSADITIVEKTEGKEKELQSLTNTESLSQSSIVEGTISNTKREIKGEPFIQLNIPSSEGSAGSPLINEKGQVVGMIAWVKIFNKSESTTIPIAIPIKKILQFIELSGAPHKLGTTDEYYRDGLDLLWQGKYEEAKAKFLKVKGLFPLHSEADRLIAEIDGIMAERYSKPWKNPTYQMVFGLIMGGGLLAALTYLLMRRKPTAKKSAPLSQAPAPSPKISVEGNGGGIHGWLELEHQGQTRRYQLNKDEYRLGRDADWSDFNIPVSWEVISRRHAILRREGEDYRIYDGDGTIPSRNGLWIDAESHVDSQYGYLLSDGDQLKIGKESHEWVVLTYFNPTSNRAGAKETKIA